MSCHSIARPLIAASRLLRGRAALVLLMVLCWLTPGPAGAQPGPGSAIAGAIDEIGSVAARVDEAASVAQAVPEAAGVGDGGDTSAEEEPAARAAAFTLNNLWLLLATAMVFMMHLGFAAVETGLTRAKNTTNILFKNTAIVALGLLTYAAVGFHLMYPETTPHGGWTLENWLGSFAPGVGPGESGLSHAGNYTYWTDFIFQGMFAATCATIVSGAVAERIKLGPFLLFSLAYVAVVYPIIGSWKWGYGWLHDLGFHDFAGSTLVHSVGGWGALAGAIVLGPRLGKYVGQNGKLRIRPIVGHSMPLATIGVFLLWFGWFGFNGGSVLSASPGAEGSYGFGGVSLVIVTTCLAGAAGMATAILTSWVIQKKPDLSMALNGALAGLVGITAGADAIAVPAAMLVGAIAGVLVVLAVILIDRARIDDPVGAISVHLVCGVWGTLAVGLFGDRGYLGSLIAGTPAYGSLVPQLVGVAGGALAFPAALGLFVLLKLTLGLRVSRHEELAGLDVGEHGMEAYGGFQIFTND